MQLVLDFLPHVLNGLMLGLLLALTTLGFMLIVSVMEVINLAHGSFFALGAYAALVIVERTPSLSPSQQFVLALAVAPLLVAAAGIVLELCLRSTYGKDPLYALLLTFGAALVIEESIRVMFGENEQKLPAVFRDTVQIAGIQYSLYRICASALALAVIGALWLFLQYTPYGARIKAGAHDSEMVRALGINLPRLRMFVFALGAGLAAFAGVILSRQQGIRPHVGTDVVIPAFLIVVIGGIGSFRGAVAGSLLIGMAISLAAKYRPEFSLLSMYVLLIVTVTFFRRGLFGKKSILDQ